MIAYDGDLINRLVDASANANEELESAKALLDAVKSHSEWTCKEKKAIDEYMTKIHKEMNRLTENQRSYYQAVRSVKTAFEETEGKIGGMFDGVEEWLKKILGIPVSAVTVPSSGFADAWNSFLNEESVAYFDKNGNGYNADGEKIKEGVHFEIAGTSGSMVDEFAKRALDAISVVNFEDIVLH